MNVDMVKEWCRSFPGSQEVYSGGTSNILSFKIEDKKFAYFKTSEPERWRFSFRVTPERFLELTDQPGVKPARYMHRFYWVTVVNVSSFHEEYLKELIEWSYTRAVSGLPKKLQSKYYGQLELWRA